MESNFIPNILEDFWGKDGSSSITDERFNDVKQILKSVIETKNCDALKKLTPIQFYCFDLMVETTCGDEHKAYLQACQDMFSRSSNLKELQMTTRALLVQHGYSEESTAELDQLLEATEGNPENLDQFSFVRWAVLNARGQNVRKSELFRSYEITLKKNRQEFEKVKSEIDSWMTKLIEDHETMWQLHEKSFHQKSIPLMYRNWERFIFEIEKRYGTHVFVGKVYKNYAVSLENKGQVQDSLRAYEKAYENAKYNQDAILSANILTFWARKLLYELHLEEALNKLELAQMLISKERHRELNAKISLAKARVHYASFMIEVKKCYEFGFFPEDKLSRVFGEDIIKNVEMDPPMQQLIHANFKKNPCKFGKGCRNDSCFNLH